MGKILIINSTFNRVLACPLLCLAAWSQAQTPFKVSNKSPYPWTLVLRGAELRGVVQTEGKGEQVLATKAVPAADSTVALQPGCWVTLAMTSGALDACTGLGLLDRTGYSPFCLLLLPTAQVHPEGRPGWVMGFPEPFNAFSEREQFNIVGLPLGTEFIIYQGSYLSSAAPLAGWEAALAVAAARAQVKADHQVEEFKQLKPLARDTRPILEPAEPLALPLSFSQAALGQPLGASALPAGRPRHPRAAVSENKRPAMGQTLAGSPGAADEARPGKRTRATFEQGQEVEGQPPLKRARAEETAAVPESAAPEPGMAGAAADPFRRTSSQTIINNDTRDWLLLLPKLDRVLELHRFPPPRGQEPKAGRPPIELLDPAVAFSIPIAANSVVRFLIPMDGDAKHLDFALARMDAGDPLQNYVPFRWNLDGAGSRVQPHWGPGFSAPGPWHSHCEVDPGALSLTLVAASGPVLVDGQQAEATLPELPALAGDWPDSVLTLDEDSPE